MKQFLSKLLARVQKSHKRPGPLSQNRRVRPQVECLEDRQLLSASALSNLLDVPVQFNLRQADGHLLMTRGGDQTDTKTTPQQLYQGKDIAGHQVAFEWTRDNHLKEFTPDKDQWVDIGPADQVLQDGSNDVFLTPSSSKNLFTKTLSDLRNKKVLDFEADDIDTVRVLEANKELELQKSGDNWQIKKPIDTKADGGDVSSFISSVRFARASSFPENPVDARTASLDPPAIRITLHDGKAKADRVLLIGGTPEAGKYYARDASRDVIFIIDKEIPEKARRPISGAPDRSPGADRRELRGSALQRDDNCRAAIQRPASWLALRGPRFRW